jgi:NADPH2:quinone reductase
MVTEQTHNFGLSFLIEDYDIVQSEVPKPKEGQVLIKGAYSGVNHGDELYYKKKIIR